MRHRPFRLGTPVLVMAAASLLVACARDEGRRNGLTAPAGADATQRKAGEAATVASRAALDLAITTEIESRLARDRQLGALDIRVETTRGRVLLRGNAPDTDARGHAARLSQGVVGVVDIQNDVSVQVLSR